MSNDDRQTSAPPAVTAEPGETVPAPVEVNDVLAVFPNDPPVLAEPEMLVAAMRYLQKRIPEFTHLSLDEKRSHARAANLDPEFIEHGLQAACVFRSTEMLVHRTGEELQQEQEEARRWDQVIVELKALTAGIEAANLKRKHRLGKAILRIYKMIGIYLQGDGSEDVHMRPYFENMKRAYARTQRFRKGRKKGERD